MCTMYNFHVGIIHCTNISIWFLTPQFGIHRIKGKNYFKIGSLKSFLYQQHRKGNEQH